MTARGLLGERPEDLQAGRALILGVERRVSGRLEQGETSRAALHGRRAGSADAQRCSIRLLGEPATDPLDFANDLAHVISAEAKSELVTADPGRGLCGRAAFLDHAGTTRESSRVIA